MIVVGIDPGTKTGVGVWDTDRRELNLVASMTTDQAQDFVRYLKPDMVIVEDANKRRAFNRMDLLQKKYGAAVREGAGAAKRDSRIWIDFLTNKAIPFIAQGPAQGKTKWPAKKFRIVTGWTKRTNEHGRDAALIVYGLNTVMATGLMQSWRQHASKGT